MEKKNFIDKFKGFYHNKNGKAILFFSFYAVFFLILALSLSKEKNNDIPKENNVSNFLSISDVINLDNYKYSISVNDDGNLVNYYGSKKVIDYNDFEYKYFFEPTSINQLTKKGIIKENNQYEISNEVLNKLLNTEKNDGNNYLVIYPYEDKVVTNLDLHEYMNKNIYSIEIIYQRSANE